MIIHATTSSRHNITFLVDIAIITSGLTGTSTFTFTHEIMVSYTKSISTHVLGSKMSTDNLKYSVSSWR